MPRGRRDREKRLERALAECESAVLSIEGVSGVALGEEGGAPRIVVYLARPSAELRARIAGEYGGVPVKLAVSGAFEAQ